MSKSKLPIYHNILAFLLILILIVSCSNSDQKIKYINPNENPTLVDQDWYKDKKCVAPCWHGVYVGDSTKDEALEIAKTLTFIDAEKTTEIGTEAFVFPCKRPLNQDCIGMTFFDGKLDSVRLYLNYQITFDQVVEKIGPPDSFYYAHNRGVGCVVNILWIKRQIELSYGDNPSAFEDDLCERINVAGNRLPKDLVVRQVHYMTSKRLGELIEIVQNPDTGANYILWNGFAE